jgi:hypothetical protein
MGFVSPLTGCDKVFDDHDDTAIGIIAISSANAGCFPRHLVVEFIDRVGIRVTSPANADCLWLGSAH